MKHSRNFLFKVSVYLNWRANVSAVLGWGFELKVAKSYGDIQFGV